MDFDTEPDINGQIQVGDFLVPMDPMDLLQCESCQ